MLNRIVGSDVANILSSTIVDWDRFSNKTILITGANGMLPSYMIFTLLEIVKCKVVALVRNKDKAEMVFKGIMDNYNFELLVQDVCKPIYYNGKIDYIIHAASQASSKFYEVDPVGTILANVRGTENILHLALYKKVESVLFFSSAEVYGQIEKTPISEGLFGYIDISNIRSCYSESKRLGESLCISWSYQYGIPVKIVRPFHTFGPGIQENDGRVFADFVYDIHNKRDIILKSNGLAVRSFCYISDAVVAYFKILLDGIDREAYNVGNPRNAISIRDLAYLLVSLYPEKSLSVKFEFDYCKTEMSSPNISHIPDISKVNSLGWTPVVSLEECFLRTIDSLS